MYESFEHTADLGLRVRAPDLDTLFRESAQGLFSLIAEPAPGPVETVPLEFQIAGERPDYLLLDWLNELLYTFETRQLLVERVEVRIDSRGLRARARGRPLRPARDCLLHEVKAITYHGLRVEREAEGWLAEVIVDI